MLTFFVVLQVIVAIFMILVVLLQPGNRGGASAALGGAGGDTVFGGRGANTLLAKITFGAAVVFMVSNFTLSFLSMPPKSVLDTAGALKQAQPALPVVPSIPDSTETIKGTAKESGKAP